MKSGRHGEQERKSWIRGRRYKVHEQWETWRTRERERGLDEREKKKIHGV